MQQCGSDGTALDSARPGSDISSNIKVNPTRGVATHPATKEEYAEMKLGIKDREILQRERTVTKLEAIEDRATGTWHFRFRFLDHSMKVKTITVAGDIAFSVTALLPQLYKAGADLPADERKAKDVVNAAIAQEPTRVVHCVARPGWQVDKDGTLRYSYGNKLIGPPAKNLAPPFDVKRRGPSGKITRGSLPEWQRRVGATAKKSPAATLLISAAFAASLLPFAEIMSFGLNIFGGGKRGKSVALTAGGSVVGLGLEENLLTLGATTAAILEQAGAWTDQLLLVNEGGTIRGKRRDAYPKLRELTFALNAGHDTIRHSWWGASGDSFRLIYVVSAEHSTNEYAAMARESRDDGELVRLVDFPAIVPATGSIFAVLPEGKSAMEATSEFRTDCRECSGTPFPPYLRYLTQFNKAELEAKVRQLIKEFLAYVRAEITDGVTRHLALLFAALYLGARMADEAEVWRWGKAQLLSAIAYCFRVAKRTMRPLDAPDALPSALEVLRARLQSSEVVERRPGATSLGNSNAAGFFERTGSTITYTVRTVKLKEWLGSELRAHLVLRDLFARNLLQIGRAASGPGLTDEDLNGRTLRWPGGKVIRSFRFLDPFPGQKF
jgi:putative DNA primase/helicase